MSELHNSLKDILNELLKDTEIQENIVKIVGKGRKQEDEFLKRIEVLEEENRILYQQLEEIRLEREKLNEASRRLEEENREIKSSRDEAYRMLREQKKEFEPLEEIKGIWKGLCGVDKGQKAYMKKLCGSWDVKAFVALGKDKNGIKQLWNFIRDEIMNSGKGMENIRVLAEYFELCISVYNMTNIKKECYVKIEVEIGGEFDSRQCIKTSESVVNGVVTEVLLNGYCIQDDILKPVVLVR